ncbi:MAG: glycosyltransferase family 4 protein [Acidimicrobiia bacterium]|nr:glycosyltransferase family 4 protein [Acidimicrobiia bacterium]
MRILHVDMGREMRGGQWQVLHLLRGLKGRGHECELVTRAGSELGPVLRGEGYVVHEGGWMAVRRLTREFDVTHAHDARGHAMGAVAGAEKLVVARRVAFAVGKGWMSRWKYGRAKRFVAVSQYVAGVLREAGVEESRIRVVYDGVPLLEMRELGKVIVAPASPDPAKGTDLAMEAARMAGVQVKFSHDLEEDLPGAAAFVYLTREEGLGSGILLAMSAGVPVLASAVGGIPEIVEDGVTGLLTGNEPGMIAVRLTRLVEDRAMARTLGETGRVSVMERFTLERMVEATENVYREVLG